MDLIQTTYSLAGMRAVLDHVEGNIDDEVLCETFLKAEKAFNKHFYSKSARKAYVCSVCKKKGHTKSTCPNLPAEKEEEESSSEEDEEEEEQQQPSKKKSKKK